MKSNLFATPLWTDTFSVDFDDLIARCYQFKAEQQSVTVSNYGGYQSPVFTLPDVFPELHAALGPCLQTIAAEVGGSLSLTAPWLNINKKGDFNLPHVHSMSWLSAVLYLQVPENGGKLIFSNPTPAVHYPLSSSHPLFFGTYGVVPKQGLIAVFPSYLEHYVEPHNSDQDRISIAMNLKIG